MGSYDNSLIESLMKKIDENFDKLKTEFNEKFEQMDKNFDKLKTEFNEKFEQMDKNFDKLKTEFNEMNNKFTILNNEMLVMQKVNNLILDSRVDFNIKKPLQTVVSTSFLGDLEEINSIYRI